MVSLSITKVSLCPVIDNRGLVIDNRGLVIDNRGIVIDNNGLVIDTRGLVIDNSGLVIDNRGLVIDNRGLVIDNRGLVIVRLRLPGRYIGKQFQFLDLVTMRRSRAENMLRIRLANMSMRR
jgi:hypothetical protein